MDIEWNVHVTKEDEYIICIYCMQRKINPEIDMPTKYYIFLVRKRPISLQYCDYYIL